MAAPPNLAAAAKEAAAEPEDESAVLPAAGREPGLASQSANFLEKHWPTVWPLPERPWDLHHVQKLFAELPEPLLAEEAPPGPEEEPEPEPELPEAEPDALELFPERPDRLPLPEAAEAALARASSVPAASRTPSGVFSRP